MTSREAEIQARLDAATPGPWEAYDPGDGTARLWTVRDNEDDAERLIHEPIGYLDWNNGALIANAPTDLAYLLTRVAELEAQVAAVRELHVEQFSQWFNESGEPIASPVSVGCLCGSYRYPCPTIVALDSAGGGE